MSAVIRQCRAREIFENPRGQALIDEYSAECANALLGKPAPSLDYYENLEAAGIGQCFAAYQSLPWDPIGDQRLVGFAMVLIAVVPHFSLALGNYESVFVSKDASCGGQLMDAVEQYAKECGCRYFFVTAPLGSRLARLCFMCADEYLHTNHVFMKCLS